MWFILRGPFCDDGGSRRKWPVCGRVQGKAVRVFPLYWNPNVGGNKRSAKCKWDPCLPSPVPVLRQRGLRMRYSVLSLLRWIPQYFRICWQYPWIFLVIVWRSKSSEAHALEYTVNAGSALTITAIWASRITLDECSLQSLVCLQSGSPQKGSTVYCNEVVFCLARFHGARCVLPGHLCPAGIQLYMVS